MSKLLFLHAFRGGVFYLAGTQTSRTVTQHNHFHEQEEDPQRYTERAGAQAFVTAAFHDPTPDFRPVRIRQQPEMSWRKTPCLQQSTAA